MREHRSWKRAARWSVLIAAGAALAAGTAAARPTSDGAPLTSTGLAAKLARTKAALDRYQSVAVAEADGYVASSPCTQTPTDPGLTSYGGGMGIHYVNPALIGRPLTPKKPAILVYA